MQQPVHLLGIVPYEGMKTLLASLAEEYPQIKIDVFVGNMEEGIAIAKRQFPNQYDAVISRGGTARLLQQISLPVIDIKFSPHDILCALQLSGELHEKLAMVAYADVTVSAQILCELLNYQVEIFTMQSIDELEPTLRRLQEERYDTVLCDVTADAIAKSLGLNTIFITSGLESLRDALDRAVTLCSSQDHLRRENLLFRELLCEQAGQAAVFNRDRDLIFSTTGTLSSELLELFQRELEEPQEEKRVIRSANGMQYSIRVYPVVTDPGYTAVYYTARKFPFSRSQTGIHIYSRQEAEAKAYNNGFHFRDMFSPSGDGLKLLARSMVPVLIIGEDGTCMGRAAAHLHVQGPLKGGPLISINCSLLTDKSWAFLLFYTNSPLSETESTLYFSHIDALSSRCRLRLMETLAEGDICRRNRVVFSCVCRSGEQMSQKGAEFLNRLNCRVLYLQPLRKLTDAIPAQINSALSHLNAYRPYPVLGAEPEALRLLQSFSWPHNYTQFQRVIEDLAETSERLITAENVRQALQKEQYGIAYTSCTGDDSEPLDLSRTLDEISQSVAKRVLVETGGNQSAAAKRLGISRTTLRRLVNT